ncbi:MAG: hypothetical protein JKY50_05930 [Oleispira sp.]|nr:hypothetical protein [Oleispira sp.]MBL4880543.1 hypothetical protein [Oleispira sp.]
MRFKQPNVETIEEALAAEGVDAPYGDWIKKVITNLNTIIEKSPRNYRNYGPYWYRVKRLLIANGFDYEDDFEGGIIAPSIPDHAALASAIMMSASNAANATFSNTHQLDDGEGGLFSYVLEDAELEVKILECAVIST